MARFKVKKVKKIPRGLYYSVNDYYNHPNSPYNSFIRNIKKKGR